MDRAELRSNAGLFAQEAGKNSSLVDSWSGCNFFFDSSWYASVILQSSEYYYVRLNGL